MIIVLKLVGGIVVLCSQFMVLLIMMCMCGLFSELVLMLCRVVCVSLMIVGLSFICMICLMLGWCSSLWVVSLLLLLSISIECVLLEIVGQIRFLVQWYLLWVQNCKFLFRQRCRLLLWWVIMIFWQVLCWQVMIGLVQSCWWLVVLMLWECISSVVISLSVVVSVYKVVISCWLDMMWCSRKIDIILVVVRLMMLVIVVLWIIFNCGSSRNGQVSLLINVFRQLVVLRLVRVCLVLVVFVMWLCCNSVISSGILVLISLLIRVVFIVRISVDLLSLFRNVNVVYSVVVDNLLMMFSIVFMVMNVMVVCVSSGLISKVFVFSVVMQFVMIREVVMILLLFRFVVSVSSVSL